LFAEKLTNDFTCAISNMPGVVKPFYLMSKKGVRINGTWG